MTSAEELTSIYPGDLIRREIDDKIVIYFDLYNLDEDLHQVIAVNLTKRWVRGFVVVLGRQLPTNIISNSG